MNAKPLGRFVLTCLLALGALLALAALLTPASSVRGVFLNEIAACAAACRSASERDIALVRARFAGFAQRAALLEASPRLEVLAEASAADPLAGLGRKLRQALHERLLTAQALAELAVMRWHRLKFVLLLLAFWTFAVVVDAFAQRAIAHQNFEAPRPAVSFAGALFFAGLLAAGASLACAPISGAAGAGIFCATFGTLGLHAWVRYFHRTSP